MGAESKDTLPFMPNREELQRLLDSRHDVDGDRFRYFGMAMMSVFNDAPSEQATTLQGILAEHTPITLDDMRAVIDAATILTP